MGKLRCLLQEKFTFVLGGPFIWTHPVSTFLPVSFLCKHFTLTATLAAALTFQNGQVSSVNGRDCLLPSDKERLMLQTCQMTLLFQEPITLVPR